MNTPRISVCLYSDANFLSLSILENLLSKNCQIVVVAKDLEKWKKITKHLASKNRFLITDLRDLEDIPQFSYSIFCGGFISKSNAYKSFKEFSDYKPLNAPKSFVIFPFESYSPKDDGLINLTDNLCVIYMGDLIGPRIDLESDLLVNRLIREIVTSRELTLTVGEIFYPIFVNDAARTVTKWLFSFGPYGKELFLLGPQVSSTEFWSANQKIVNMITPKYENTKERRFIPKNINIESLATNLSFALRETYRWLSQPGVLVAPRKVKVSSIKNAHKYPKYFWPILISTIFVLGFPFLMAVCSVGLMYFSYKNILAGRSDSAVSKILVAKTMFVIGRGESSAFSWIPLVGSPYKEAGFISNIGQEGADAALSAIPLIKTANDMFIKVLGNAVYDPTSASVELADGMDLLARDVGVIQAQTTFAENSGLLSARILLNRVNFEQLRNFFVQGKTLASNLPNILGKDQRKTYLVLFQNNMELRPTGGFIGSFGLLTFDGGRMTDLSVNDVYSADGQLNGHVEPPAPIKKYLNEANWWLRDSNWDPDFPTSAKRAEWFLDKEMNTQVDGVLAIDLKTVSEALKTTGPIFLADYNLDITSDNLYEKTQAEADQQFFPGSHNKASFLTALSRNLISDVEKLGSGQKLLVLKSFLSDFQDRHIQAFLHNDASQNALSALGWSGDIASPNCGQDCYADLVGLVEANVGVNKANFFITRKIDLAVTLDKGLVTRKVSLTLNNSANTALGPSGVYKVYIRTFVPDDSDLISLKVISGENEEILTPEIVESHGRREVGVFAQVLNGQSQRIEFTWATNPQNKLSFSSYGLYIRKQAGVSDDPWHISIGSANPALTNQGLYTYNTVLARDFFSRFGR